MPRLPCPVTLVMRGWGWRGWRWSSSLTAPQLLAGGCREGYGLLLTSHIGSGTGQSRYPEMLKEKQNQNPSKLVEADCQGKEQP